MYPKMFRCHLALPKAMVRWGAPRWVALGLLGAIGCATSTPTGLLDRAASRTSDGRGSARNLALAGFHALLVTGDAERARERLDAAIAADDGEPLALAGQMELAARSLDIRKRVAFALALIRTAPRHALAPSAAQTLEGLAGSADSVDRTLSERIPPLLLRGVPGLVAQPLRAALWKASHLDPSSSESKRQLASMGVPTAAVLAGPFDAWRDLSLEKRTEAEMRGSLDGIAPGPTGELSRREIVDAQGIFTLHGEPFRGDTYVFAIDVVTSSNEEWILTAATEMDFAAVIDGSLICERISWRKQPFTRTQQRFQLPAGTHRLILRASRGLTDGGLQLWLTRADGAPTNAIFQAAKGAAADWSGTKVRLVAAGTSADATAGIARSLRSETGDALARYLAASATHGYDPNGAAALLAGLPPNFKGSSLHVLRAQMALEDDALPRRVRSGRARAELEQALAADPNNLLARLLASLVARNEGRLRESLDRLADVAEPPAPILLARAEALKALGADASAFHSAGDAVEKLPGFCEALLLRYALTRQREATAESKALLQDAAHCSGRDIREGDLARSSGRLEDAVEAYERFYSNHPAHLDPAMTLAELLSANKNYPAAIQVLTNVAAQWPRAANPIIARANVEERAGNLEAALVDRKAALVLDGSNLALARQVSRATQGHEPLEEEAISTKEAIAETDSQEGVDGASSMFILDYAGVRVFPDGSAIERTHIIKKALAQEGVAAISEVQIPDDASVLTLRTLKADGRTLEPEAFEGKDTVSLPGVDVGDFIEYEYLSARPARALGWPGFTSAAFFFAAPRQANARSTYVVKAPAGTPLKVDSRFVRVKAPHREGDFEVFRHEERQVPPFIPEPNAPPSPTEWLPFVIVGYGDEGATGTLMRYSEFLVRKATANEDIARFARDAAGSAQGRAAVASVYASVMKHIVGSDTGPATDAISTLAQRRGSRSALLVAALRSLGFAPRFALVRTLASDPSSFTFPPDSLYNFLCVYVPLEGGPPLWLNPAVRYAPFNVLPDIALGGRSAWLLAQPGDPLRQLLTPANDSSPDKQVVLALSVDTKGAMTGTGAETYSGYAASGLIEWLQSVSTEKQRQQFEASLSRYFGGATLSDLTVTPHPENTPSVVLNYRITAGRFAQAVGQGRLASGPITYPLFLGSRYIANSVRNSDLFIPQGERATAHTTLALPQGWHLHATSAAADLQVLQNRFRRREVQSGATLTVDEDYQIPAERVPVKEYATFADFAGAVDLQQQRELLFEKE